MSSNAVKYKMPMRPYPTLVDFSKHITLTASNLELFFFESGKQNSTHLVMLHGLGDEADTWRHVFKPLSEEFHTFALDLPGFGRSSQPDVDYTPQFMMDTIIRFLDQLSVPSAIVMGSSLGGILAQGLAITHPTRVTGIILVGGSLIQAEPMGDWSHRLMQIPLLGEWLYTRLRKDPDAAFDSLNNVYHDIQALPRADRDFLFTRVNQRVWSDGQRRAYFSTLRNLSPWVKEIQYNLANRLAKLEIPTLVIRGKFDSLFAETTAEMIVATQPNAEKATIKDAGHLPHQENPSEFLSALNAWLEEHM